MTQWLDVGLARDLPLCYATAVGHPRSAAKSDTWLKVAAMAHVQSHGARVLLPITEMATRSKISYVEGPENVRIELVQPPA